MALDKATGASSRTSSPARRRTCGRRARSRRPTGTLKLVAKKLKLEVAARARAQGGGRRRRSARVVRRRRARADRRRARDARRRARGSRGALGHPPGRAPAHRRDAGARRRRLRALGRRSTRSSTFPATPERAVRARLSLRRRGRRSGRRASRTQEAPGWYDAKGRQPVSRRLALAGSARADRVALQSAPHASGAARRHAAQRRRLRRAGRARRSTRRPRGSSRASGTRGPCGNRVEIAHAGDITSIYCHLSRFAAGASRGAARRAAAAHRVRRADRSRDGPASALRHPQRRRLRRPDDAPARRRARRSRGLSATSSTAQRAALDAELDGDPAPGVDAASRRRPPEPGRPFYEEP